MEDLNLPIIKDFPESNKYLSMDEYLEFVNFNATHVRKKKLSKKDEMAMRVNVPFVLK